jgi:hypothetical protein
VQWSAEFGDGREREHAEEMATPWFGINQDCYTQIWAELVHERERLLIALAADVAERRRGHGLIADTDCSSWLTESPGDPGQRTNCALW